MKLIHQSFACGLATALAGIFACAGEIADPVGAEAKTSGSGSMPSGSGESGTPSSSGALGSSGVPGGQAAKPGPAEVGSGCVGDSVLLPPKLRRLSELQIKNSLRDIFGDIFDPAVWPALEDGAKLIGMNTTADKLQVNGLNFSRMYDASRDVVRTLIRDHHEIKECAANQGSDGCVTQLLRDYGTRVWRRPLSPDELTRLTSEFSEFADNAGKLEFAFNALLLGSDFLFRSEIGSVEGARRSLDNYELVSFLSYAVWNSTPDDELLSLAAQATPMTESDLRGQLDRMLKEPRANSALVEIYKDYLKLDLVLERDKEASFHFTSSVRRKILESAELMLADNLSSGASVMDVFGGSDFYVNDEVAPYFGVTAAPGPLKATLVAESERDGLLNHPAFLAVHSTLNASGIVKRGVFTLEQLLCRALPDPPADVASIAPPEDLVREETSERDFLLATHSSQPACVGCHTSIDPAGFGFENFDAVGRYRTSEKGDVPIDASGSLEGVGAYSTGAEYARALRSSSLMNECVNRRFLEHFVGQDLSPKSCEVQTYNQLLAQGDGGVRGLFESLMRLKSVSARQLVQGSGK